MWWKVRLKIEVSGRRSSFTREGIRGVKGRVSPSIVPFLSLSFQEERYWCNRLLTEWPFLRAFKRSSDGLR